MSHPDGLPDLLLDRSLGRKEVPELLRAEGLRLVTLAEHYGNPARRDNRGHRVASPLWRTQMARDHEGRPDPIRRCRTQGAHRELLARRPRPPDDGHSRGGPLRHRSQTVAGAGRHSSPHGPLVRGALHELLPRHDHGHWPTSNRSSAWSKSPPTVAFHSTTRNGGSGIWMRPSTR